MIFTDYKIDHAPEILSQLQATSLGTVEKNTITLKSSEIRLYGKRVNEHASIYLGIGSTSQDYIVKRSGTNDEQLVVIDFQLKSDLILTKDREREKIVLGSYISDSIYTSQVKYGNTENIRYLTIIANRDYLLSLCSPEGKLFRLLTTENDFIQSCQTELNTYWEIYELSEYVFEEVDHNKLLLEGFFLKILARFITSFDAERPVDRSVGDYDLRTIGEAKKFMDNSIERQISLNQILDIVAMSESKFRSLFKRTYGESPFFYLKRKKLWRSKELIESGIPISNVVTKIGYINHSYFTRMFRKEFGVTPSQHQKLYAENL